MAISTKSIWEKAMTNLVIDFPVFAELIAKIGCQFVRTGKNGSLIWTTGKKIFLNEDKFEFYSENPIVTDDEGNEYNMTITYKEMMFLLSHELMHLLNLTFDRCKNVGLYPEDVCTPEGRRRHEIWNDATDYEINSYLLNNESTDHSTGDKRKNPLGKMPALGCYDDRFIDMQAEEIYKILVNEEKKNNGGHLMMPVPMPNGSSSNGTDPENGGNMPRPGIAPGLDAMDAHVPITDEDTKNEIKDRLSEVFGSRGNGLGESALDRSLGHTYKPQPFNWRKALTKYIRSYIKANYTWNKPSRAGVASGLILPSQGTTPKLHIGVAIDTSGSISDKEINTMMDHVFTILQQFKSFEIDMWACGSVVYKNSLLKLTAANKRDIHKFEATSDGGNDMRQNFKFIKEHYKGKDKIDMLMILSDFIDPLSGDKTTTSPCPCVFMCIDNKQFEKPALIKGEVIPFKIDADKADY